MPSIPNVHRRGAVYYWRRRLPSARGLGSHFVLTLRTTNQAHAREIGARLDVEMSRMFQSKHEAGGDPRLTGDHMKAIFSAVALKQREKLERVAAFDRLQPTFNIEDSRATDRAMGHVYRLLATHGADFRFTIATVSQLQAAGLTDVEIEKVAIYLVELRTNGLHVDKRGRLEGLLSTVGAPPTMLNLALAQTIKHRAMAAALLDPSGRWELPVGHDAILLDAIARDAASELPPKKQKAQSNDAAVPEASPPVENSPIPAAPIEPILSDDRSPACDGVSEPIQNSGHPVDVAELLLEGSMLNVDDKTRRQVRSTARLLAKYLLQRHEIADLRDLKQVHLAGFFKFLQTELYIHYGKSEHDEGRGLIELGTLWKTKKKEDIGVDKATAERYKGHISQMFDTARSNGIAVERDLTFKGLIAKSANADRARNARPTTTVQQSQSLYHQPPFVGCKAWNELDKPGELIFHCALYFATLLFQYGGERREEVCGALVTDLIVDNGPIQYLYFEDNQYRRLKNVQSRRPMPVHPELIRLGFRAYAKIIRELGYDLLFPDLYSPTSKSPLGDRFHDQLRPILDQAGITAPGTGVHSARRGFGNNLKQKGVSGEMRGDLLGHGGDSETTERYCEHYEIELLYAEIMKLPNVTAHLEPRPIKLLPWVAAKQRPPFSQPSRTKEAKQRRRHQGSAPPS